MNFTLVEELSGCEEAMDNCDADIDCELNGGVVTLSFVNGSKIIINKQNAASDLGATRENGYHFDWKDGQWIEITAVVVS